ncbi:hypothetical protein CS8_020000 [Cupriavidus sp. 8B]
MSVPASDVPALEPRRLSNLCPPQRGAFIDLAEARLGVGILAFRLALGFPMLVLSVARTCLADSRHANYGTAMPHSYHLST